MADVIFDALIQRKGWWALGLESVTPNLYLVLFTAGPDPLECDNTFGDFTEPTATGYARILLDPDTWSDDLIDCAFVATYPQQTFTFTDNGTPDETILGHLVYENASGDIWWGQRWTTAYAIPADGGTVKVTLNFSDQQG